MTNPTSAPLTTPYLVSLESRISDVVPLPYQYTSDELRTLAPFLAAVPFDLAVSENTPLGQFARSIPQEWAYTAEDADFHTYAIIDVRNVREGDTVLSPGWHISSDYSHYMSVQTLNESQPIQVIGENILSRIDPKSDLSIAEQARLDNINREIITYSVHLNEVTHIGKHTPFYAVPATTADVVCLFRAVALPNPLTELPQ